MYILSLFLLPVLIQSFSSTGLFAVTTHKTSSSLASTLASTLKPSLSTSSASVSTSDQEQMQKGSIEDYADYAEDYADYAEDYADYADELDLEKLVYEWEQLETDLVHLKEQEYEVSKHLPIKSRHDMLETLQPQEAHIAEAMLQTALDTVRVKMHLDSQRTVAIFEKLQESMAAQRVAEVHLKVAVDETQEAQNHFALMMESSTSNTVEEQIYSFTRARAARQVEQKMKGVVDQLEQETKEIHEEYKNLYNVLDSYENSEQQLVVALEALQVIKAEMELEGKVHTKYTHDDYLYKFLPL